MSWAIEQGDVTEVLKGFQDNVFDAVCCDPPYGFSFMGKKWDYDVPSVELWREVLRVLKPGAPLVAFGGSRTYHRMACRVEDAGFELRDCLLYLHGKGFPKSLDISKAIDKDAGHWRGRAGAVTSANDALGGPNYERTPKGEPITAAAAWQGYGTALKPAFEPAILARKPLDGTVANNVARWGVGGLAIDACRIAATDLKPVTQGMGVRTSWDTRSEPSVFEPNDAGRWPANLILDEEAAALLDEQAGPRPSAPYPENTVSGNVLPLTKRAAGGYSDSGGPSRFFKITEPDRFHYSSKVSTKEREAGVDYERLEMEFTWENEVLKVALLVETESSPPRVICVSGMSSNSASEWSMWLFGSHTSGLFPPGCKFTTKTKTSSITESKIWKLSHRLRTNVSIPDANSETENGGSPVPFAANSNQSIENTGTSLGEDIRPSPGASPVMLRELFGRSKSAAVSLGVASNHPTMKPISLTTWLAKLILPPTPSPCLLVPFAGAGSEMIGGIKAGWAHVFGVEKELEYCEIARARLAHWCPEKRVA